MWPAVLAACSAMLSCGAWAAHVDAFVQVVVAGGAADGVVGGQLGHAGAVQEPADDQHRLFEAAQRPAAGTGTAAEAFGV